MSCSINHNSKIYKWNISKKALTEQLYPLLYKNNEIAGDFEIEFSKKQTSHRVTFVNGDKDSVEAPEAIVNYHTHPISCYLGEKTVWGWPSGEDMRESVLFGLKGSVAHVIPSVEGTYVCQVNPCILENLIHLDTIINPRIKSIPKKLKEVLEEYEYDPVEFFRGLIVLCIEVCFRSTHVFRGYDFNKEHDCSARDFIEYSNAFQLKNMFQKKGVKGCGSLKCNSIWIFEDKLHEKITFKEYVEDFENDAQVYLCDSKGEANYSDISLLDAIELGAINFIKKLKLGSSCKYPDKLWSERWFLLSLAENKVLINNKKINYNSKKLTADDRMQFLYDSFQIVSRDPTYFDEPKNGVIYLTKGPVFHFFDMRGSCDYKHVADSLKKDPEQTKRRRSMKKLKGKNSKKVHPKGHPAKKARQKRRSKKKGSKKELILIGSPQCKFCVNAVEKLSKKNKLDVSYFGTIQEAVMAANDYAFGNPHAGKITSIPAVFEKGSRERIEDYYSLI